MLGAVVLCSCAMSLFVSVDQAAALLRERVLGSAFPVAQTFGPIPVLLPIT